MLRKALKDHNIILASGSPRRQDFFSQLDIEYIIDVREVVEDFDPALQREGITNYLAQLKASVFTDLQSNDILITSDTIVWKDKIALNKPKDAQDAHNMLRNLSGSMHEVITSVCFTSKNYQETLFDVTKVWFKELSDEEIDYYIKNYKPFDKAGSYGVQEWLGYVGIDKLEGSYFNVMGLPTRLVYKTLMELAYRSH